MDCGQVFSGFTTTRGALDVNKRWLLLGVLLGGLVLVVTSWPDQLTRIIACDVGQGDAILVTQGFHQALIDGGPDTAVLTCLGKYLPRNDRQIELVVVTHLDADHIGGLVAVLAQYRVGLLLVPVSTKDTELADQLWEQIDGIVRSGTVLKQPILGQQIRFPLVEPPPFLPFEQGSPFRIDQSSALTFMVLSPQVDMVSDCGKNQAIPETVLSAFAKNRPQCASSGLTANDLSTVLLLQVDQIKVLLTGDIEGKHEAALATNPLIRGVDILKVSHHGAKNATSELLLVATRPEKALISSGKSNRYGHPTPEVLARLQQFDIEVWRTDQLGDVVIATDGETYWLEGD